MKFSFGIQDKSLRREHKYKWYHVEKLQYNRSESGPNQYCSKHALVDFPANLGHVEEQFKELILKKERARPQHKHARRDFLGEMHTSFTSSRIAKETTDDCKTLTRSIFKVVLTLVMFSGLGGHLPESSVRLVWCENSSCPGVVQRTDLFVR